MMLQMRRRADFLRSSLPLFSSPPAPLSLFLSDSSRRSFTPEGHWLMTSQFDLASFIQTAM